VWVFRFGKWVVRRIGRFWLAALELAAPANIAAAVVLPKLFVDPSKPAPNWSIWWAVIAAIAQIFVSYLSKSSAVSAQNAAADILIKYKHFTAGNLSHLLKALVERELTRARDLKRDLLEHSVDVAKDYLELPRGDNRLTATWAVPRENFTKWEVVAYDRNQAHRQTGRLRDLKEGFPGAATAFLTGNRQFIVDTMAASCREFFELDAPPPYRAILSMPARSMNMRNTSANVTINGEPNVILGVLNIDCSECGVLTEDVWAVLYDVVYMLGILEHLEHLQGANEHAARSEFASP
jgi:hypothetical protein